MMHLRRLPRHGVAAHLANTAAAASRIGAFPVAVPACVSTVPRLSVRSFASFKRQRAGDGSFVRRAPAGVGFREVANDEEDGGEQADEAGADEAAADQQLFAEISNRQRENSHPTQRAPPVRHREVELTFDNQPVAADAADAADRSDTYTPIRPYFDPRSKNVDTASSSTRSVPPKPKYTSSRQTPAQLAWKAHASSNHSNARANMDEDTTAVDDGDATMATGRRGLNESRDASARSRYAARHSLGRDAAASSVSASTTAWPEPSRPHVASSTFASSDHVSNEQRSSDETRFEQQRETRNSRGWPEPANDDAERSPSRYNERQRDRDGWSGGIRSSRPPVERADHERAPHPSERDATYWRDRSTTPPFRSSAASHERSYDRELPTPPSSGFRAFGDRQDRNGGTRPRDRDRAQRRDATDYDWPRDAREDRASRSMDRRNNSYNSNSGYANGRDRLYRNNVADVAQEAARAQSRVGMVYGELLYGFHPVVSALMARKRAGFHRLYLQENKADLNPGPSGVQRSKVDREAAATAEKQVTQVLDLARRLAVDVQYVSRHQMNLASENRPHNGFLLDAAPLAPEVVHSPGDMRTHLAEVAARSHGGDAAVGQTWLLLDEVVDPQNLGAMLRSAYYFGVAGVLLCAKNSAPLSPVTSKASSGAQETIKLLTVASTPRFLHRIRAHEWNVVGLTLAPKSVDLRDLAATLEKRDAEMLSAVTTTDAAQPETAAAPTNVEAEVPSVEPTHANSETALSAEPTTDEAAAEPEVDDESDLSDSSLPRAVKHTLLVVGNEGRGLRHIVAENCHVLAKIAGGTGGAPTTSNDQAHVFVDSLNVSNALAIALYELSGRKQRA